MEETVSHTSGLVRAYLFITSHVYELETWPRVTLAAK